MAEDKNVSHLDLVRHSMAHVMAEAVLSFFPDAKIAIGPSIENGFYYDFDLSRSLTIEDLDLISDKMKEIIKEGGAFEKKVVSKKEASEIFSNQPYKLELIEALPEVEEISIYTNGAFTDLCRGPHVESASKLNPQSFKLLSVAGAYWRGNENNPMLQRIYGTAWSNPKELRLYLTQLEEIEKRDHRKLGKELDLFSMHEEAGAGLVYWHPNGARIRMEVENFWRAQHYDNGYEMVYTPHVGKSWLWETSGHLDFYKEGMYPKMEMDNADFYAKPMNCPFHIMIYNNSKHSYRDLPCRWAELGTVYRYEKAGALHGLLRVRGFTQDDAHIICTPSQVEDEIVEVLRFSLEMLKAFGFTEYKAYISTKPEKSVGREEDWELATVSLKKAVDREGLEYEIDNGGGAFYGPKIDIKIKDALGREWQLSTIQFDFNLPERFKMAFTDSDGVEKRPFMIHRALLGSIERFFGVLIEHYAGAFPVWLSPEQVRIVPVAEPFFEYAKEVEQLLKKKGIRATADLSDDRMNAKIRVAQTKKIPYALILGENEKSQRSVSMRPRFSRENISMALDEFVDFVRKKVADKETI
ncbi:MAG: threonine--tRNA ligase [Spirochaetales bacterium]|nr:threonine--tRNA ligase [Spirochaetales bacterium]